MGNKLYEGVELREESKLGRSWILGSWLCRSLIMEEKLKNDTVTGRGIVKYKWCKI